MNPYPVWQPEIPATVLHRISGNAAALMQVQSLTAALRGLHAGFSVQLLHLGASRFDPAFSDGLTPSGSDTWFARDVLLHLDGTPVVWARSLCRSSAANWLGLLDCGTRPLGEKLFDGSLPLQRTPFEYTALPSDHRLPGTDGAALAARRSFFVWQQQTLGLAEYFLPGLQNFV